jgi:hypothetical protein
MTVSFLARVNNNPIEVTNKLRNEVETVARGVRAFA